MEYRRLGASGLTVSALSFGAGTFGGSGPLFGAWGSTDAQEARRLVDICLDAGITMFDTADVYSGGASEEVLGRAIKGRRDAVQISTKSGLPTGDGPGDAGTSRTRLIRTVEAALRRLAAYGPPVDDEHLFRVVDVLLELSRETGRAVPQIAVNWLLQRPTVATVIIGARNEQQLRQNLRAVGWSLTPDQMARLDAASFRSAPYPYYLYERQEGFARLSPSPLPLVR